MPAALDGLRVLDLSWGQPGGIATMVLADFGAEVIKIEPPGGDPFRTAAAAPMWLRGKQSLVLNLKTPAGVERLHELARTADVVVASYRPGVAARLGADYATLAALNPRLVYCSITGFGPRGPYARYKGYEGVVAAKSGRMLNFAGSVPHPGPVYAAVPVATHAAAQGAVQGILAALLVRLQSGCGQLVETSLLQGMLPYDLGGLMTQQFMQRFPERFPVDPNAAYLRMPTLQYHPTLTKDGRWLQLANLMEHLFHAYIAAAGLAEIYADPELATAPQLGDAAREKLRTLMLERMRERTAAEWMAIFIANGDVAAEPIVSTQEALFHPQLVYAGDVIEVEHPRLGHMRQLGPVGKLPATPARPAANSPALGEHGALAVDRPAPEPAAEPPPLPHHPLSGLLVVEFGTIIATPTAGALLADLGARVIKVEPPEGDPYRGMGGQGVGTVKTTAGKESICLDLKTAVGRQVVRRLLDRADVVLHNFRPGVAERLGIAYEQVVSTNPRVIYVSAMGYGLEGPYALRPLAHPGAGAAMGGCLWQAGKQPERYPDDLDGIKEWARRFSRANEVNPDPNSGLVFATAALLALYARATQGVGQHVEANMLVGNAYANADDFVAYDGKPPRPLVDEGLHGLHALYRLYPAAEGWVFLGCVLEQDWQQLCRAVGRDDLLTDPRFACAASRAEHDAELAAELAAVFQQRHADDWERLLVGHDVGCVRADAAPAATFWNTDAHVRENGFVREVEHLRWGTYFRHGPLVRFSRTPERQGGGVLAGQHNVQILRELGYSPDEIQELITSGVVRAEPV